MIQKTKNLIQKTKNLSVPMYFTPENEPTCSRNWESERCMFVTTYGVGGQKEACFFGNGRLFRRGDDEMGYLIPCEECPLHTNKGK